MILGTSIGLSQSAVQVPTVGLDLDAQIAALFGPSDEGAWYDPSDLSTLYQDSWGTTPVTGTGQPVGLMLDKSKGLTLGSELVVNGDLSNGLTEFISNSAGVLQNIGNQLHATVLAGDNVGGFNQGGSGQTPIPTVAGKYYKVSWDVVSATQQWRFFVGGTTITNYYDTGPQTSTGSFSVIIYSNHTTIQFGGYAVSDTLADQTAVFDNFSIRELPGNHATQSTSTARPTLQSSGGVYWLDFDGVDDGLQSSPFASSQPQPNSIGCAWKLDAFTSKQYDIVYDGISPNRHALLDSSGQVSYYSGIEVKPVSSTTNTRVSFAEYNSPASYLRLDGSLVSSGATTGTLSWGGVCLGELSTTLNTEMDGRIYAFVGVNRTLDPDEITTVENYLADKTGAFVAPVITGVPTISV